MKNKENKLFVIIPCYNCKKFLRTAVNSVLIQNYSNYEIILVDDGSTDGTSQLCDLIACESNKITVIHKENGGVSSARNKGLDYIYFEKEYFDSFIVFLDSDDALAKEAINADLLEILNEKYDLVCLQSFYCNGSLTRFAKPVPLNEGVCVGGEQSVWKHRGHSFASIVYSADYLFKNNIRFLPISYSEDKLFLIQCFCLANMIYFMNKCFYLYRNNKYSAVHTRKYGINYYDPIVRGYLQIDDICNSLKEGNRQIMIGHECARTYLIDMIQEHYKYGGTKPELDRYFKDNPDLWQLLNNKNIGGEYINNKLEKLNGMQFTNPLYHKIKGNLLRIIKRPAKIVYSVLTDQKKYPNKIYM